MVLINDEEFDKRFSLLEKSFEELKHRLSSKGEILLKKGKSRTPHDDRFIPKKIVAVEVRNKLNSSINGYMGCILGMFMILACGLISNVIATAVCLICMIVIIFVVKGLDGECKRLENKYGLEKGKTLIDTFFKRKG